MRSLGRLIVLLAGVFGAGVGAQFPEFAQQYRQRVGGALEEMRQVVADFDADAERNTLTRSEALETYGRSFDGFLRDRGVTMSGTIRRFEWLSEQQRRLAEAPPLMRPVVVMSGPDKRVLRGAWADYEPAVPVSQAGFIWAAIGFFFIAGTVSLIRQIAGILRRRRGLRLRGRTNAPV